MRFDKQLLESLALICQRAGEAIMQVYHGAEAEQYQRKADQSPVTQADLAAHHIISSALVELIDVPVLSEEKEAPPFEQRRHWRRYWLIDPLDGTRSFIARRGRFSVNIALIDDGAPSVGAVYLPASNSFFGGIPGYGAYKMEQDQWLEIGTRRLHSGGDIVSVAGGRNEPQLIKTFHGKLAEVFQHVEALSIGSAVKFCYLAAGKGDVFPCWVPTYEWDTAAGQALLEAAGGAVLTADKLPLRYNQKPSLINPSFCAVGDPKYPWGELIIYA